MSRTLFHLIFWWRMLRVAWI